MLGFIADNRTFTKLTFNGYKNTGIVTEFHKSILQGKYELACHWMAELDSSCMQEALWERILLITTKDIHLHNPYLPSYVYNKYKIFLDLLERSTHRDIRNNETHRHMLCEIIGILVFSGKGPIYNLPKLDINKFKLEEYGYTARIPIVEATSKPTDCKIIVDIVNQLFINLYNHEIHRALENLSMLLHLEKEMKKNKDFFCIYPRISVHIPAKYNQDWIWLVWQCVLSWNISNAMIYNSLFSLFLLFSHNYTSARKNSRISYIINAFLLIGQPDLQVAEIIESKYLPIVERACLNINQIYQEIIEEYTTQTVFSHSPPPAINYEVVPPPLASFPFQHQQQPPPPIQTLSIYNQHNHPHHNPPEKRPPKSRISYDSFHVASNIGLTQQQSSQPQAPPLKVEEMTSTDKFDKIDELFMTTIRPKVKK